MCISIVPSVLMCILIFTSQILGSAILTKSIISHSLSLRKLPTMPRWFDDSPLETKSHCRHSLTFNRKVTTCINGQRELLDHTSHGIEICLQCTKGPSSHQQGCIILPARRSMLSDNVQYIYTYIHIHIIDVLVQAHHQRYVNTGTNGFKALVKNTLIL